MLGAALLAGGLAVSHAAMAEDDLAAGSGYGSDNLTFERWCTELQKYPADRCAAKSAEDQASFKETQLRLQEIEVQHAKEQRQEREFRKQFDAHRDMTPITKL
jgi:hypothetical protein